MFFTKPNIPLSNSFYTEPVERVDPANPASLSEQFGQARKEDDAAHEMLSEYWNLGKVYADHNRKVKDLTGVELPNPSEMTFGYFDEDGPSNKARFYGDLQKYRDDGGTGSQTAFYDQWREKVYRERLEEVAAKHPDKRSQIIPDATFQEQGYAARNLEVKKSEDVWNRSRQTTLDRAAWLAGSVWGSFDDPVNLVTMPLGFGGKVATGARGVAMGFLKAGASNAAIEAGIQPFVQDYANRAGDFSGWAPAANAVGAAFLFGGALDAGVRSVARGLRSGMGYEPVVKDGVVESYRKIERDGTTSELPADLVARAGDNDPVAIREVAEKTGLANDPIVRTSLDAMDAETAVMRKPSEAIPDGEHVGAVQQTLRALDDPEHEPFPVIHENASPARVKALELDLLEARTELGRVSKALQISELPPAISKQLNDAQQKITARVAELETQHADMRQTLMSDDLIQMVDGGKVPREVADVVAGHVEDKAIQGRIALDLTDMKVSSPDEARNAISSLLNSPEYRQQVKRPVTPAPGLAKRELDDPYGAEAKAQLAALQAEFGDVLGVKNEADAAPAAEPDFLEAMMAPETPAPKAGPEAKVSAALDEAIAFARKILPEGTEVKVAGELEDGAGRALDAAEVNGTIFLYQHALDPKARIGHEGVHVLERRGLLDPKEIKTLAKGARKEGVFSAEQEASYREAYEGRENIDGLIAREAAAHQLEARVSADPKVQTIIDKVKAFFERLRNAMEGNGFRNADDVVDAILSGDVAKRQANPEWAQPGGPMYALAQDTDTGQAMFALRGNLRDSYGKFRVMSKEAGETLQRDFMDIEEDFARRQHANPAELAAAMESERAKLQVQRAAILNAKRQTEALKDITDFKDMYGRNDPAKGFFYLHESFGASGAKDLVNAKKDIQDEVESMMAEIIWFARKGAVTGDKRRSWNKGVRTTLENMVREAAGQDTGDKTAKTLANAWGQASEYLRKRFNAAGGDIGKLKNWIMPQYHDPDALLKMGQQKWIDYMMAKGVLDRDAMVNVKTQKPYTDGELRSVLAYTWKNITSDGEFSREIGKSGGKGAKYKQHADHRFIHFKDADAWLKYQKEVGGGDLYAAMIGHISTMSRDIAAMERFGANPELVRQRLKEQILKDAGMGRPNKSMFDELKDKVVELQSTFDAIPTKYESLMNELSKVHGELDAVRSKYAPQLGGKLSKRNVAKVEKLQTELFTIHEQLKEEWGKKTLTPEHQKLAAEISDLMDEMNRIDIYPVMSRDPIQRARRLLKRADELWASFNGTSNVPVNGIIANVLSGTRNLISSSALVFAPISAVTDQATHLGARLLIGMPATKQLASFVKGFTPADRQLALHVGIGLDQAANAFQEQARMIGAFNTRGWTGYVTDRSHAFSFLSPMTQASKVAFGLDYMRWMAGLKDTAFDVLDEGPQGMLKRGGFTEADWKALQAVQPEIISGNQMLTRKAIKEQAGEDLAEKFMIMFYRERSRAVIEGTLAGRTAIVSDTQPGSIIGEVSRSAAMLKSFPISYGHLILGQLFRSIMDGKYKSAAAYFAAIGIVGTMLGATAKQLKNVAQGRDPEDMTTAKFWGASFMQSGGAGIFGDFIASNVNRQGAGLATTLAGPLADRLGTVRDATIGNIFQYASDEKTNAGREATNLLRQWTPGALSPWYTRLAYERLIADALQSQVDPDAYGSFKRKVQSRKKTFGNDFFWAPGQGAPARGPNFGAALGR